MPAPETFPPEPPPSDWTHMYYGQPVPPHDVLTPQQEQALAKRIEAGHMARAVHEVLYMPEEAFAGVVLDSQEQHRFSQLRAIGIAGIAAYTEALRAKREPTGTAPPAGELAATARATYQRDLRTVIREGETAFSDFLSCNRRLAVHFTRKRLHPRDLLFDDVRQEVEASFVTALQRFDYTRGMKFSTYAWWWARKAMNEYIPQEYSIVPTLHVLGQLAAFQKAHQELTTQGMPATTDALAKVMKCPPKLVRELEVYKRRLHTRPLMARNKQGVEALLDPETPPELPDAYTAVDAGVDAANMTRRLFERTALTPVEEEVVRLVFTMNPGEQTPLAAVAAQRGVTAQAVRKRFESALRKLRATADRLGIAAEDVGL